MTISNKTAIFSSFPADLQAEVAQNNKSSKDTNRNFLRATKQTAIFDRCIKHLCESYRTKTHSNAKPAVEREGITLNYDTHAPIYVSGNKLIVNPLFCLDWEDLPRNLQITGLDDPKLQTREYYQDFYDHTKSCFGYGLNPVQGLEAGHFVTLEDISLIQGFLGIIHDPEATVTTINNAIQSLLGHELGHIILGHGDQSASLESHWEKIQAYTLSGFGILWIFMWCVYKVSSLLMDRRHEREADDFAARNFQGAGAGANYGFTSMIETGRRVKALECLSPLEKVVAKIAFFGNEGPINEIPAHGTLTSRISKMVAAEAEAFPS